MEERNTGRRRRKSQYMRNRRIQGILLAFLLILSMGIFTAAGLIAPDRDYSPQENRKLAQFPALTWSGLKDGSWFSGLESYVADQFVARDFWIAFQLRFNRLMGQKESNGVLLCEDHYLMEPPVTPDRLDLTAKMEAVDAFAARNPQVNSIITVVPNAVAIYRDKLPKNIPLRDQRRDLGLMETMVEHITFHNLTETLYAHRDGELYYRTDHHWTSLGAKYAFLDLAEDLEIPTVMRQYDSYPVSTTFEGTLASRSGCHEVRDTVEIYVPANNPEYYVSYEDAYESTCSIYSREALNQKDHYTVFFGGNHPRVDITTTAKTGKSLLLIKDSYANCFVQFALPYFEKIVMIDPRYYYGDLDTLLKREGITDTLFLYNLNTFLEDSALVDLLTPRGE